jgi:serine/threonine protein kinase
MAVKTAKAPRTIGKYRIVGLLGAGGSCRVYKGHNEKTGEFVAIKVLQADLANNPVQIKRFELEFGVTRLIDHPHLARVLQFGRTEGKPYIVMEFIDGRTLGERIRREGALAEAEAVRIISQVGAALEAAHKRKIIHRDVKPDNVLLTADGQAKLTDLGLAKDEEADHDLTRPLRGLGTPNFIAPEQFTDAKHADVRCDIYSLTATLYMAVTGQAPFQARGNLSIWKKKLANEVIPPRQIVPTLSEQIDQFICRGLSAAPDARPATCRQFLKELERVTAPSEMVPDSVPDVGLEPIASVAPPRPAERRATVRSLSRLKGTCRPYAADKKGQWNADVRDVSAGGMALVVSRRFEPGTVLQVKLPGTEGASRREYVVGVVRLQADSPKTWVIGCIFPRRMSDEEVQSLL